LKDQGMIELEKKAYDWDSSLAPVQVDEVIMGNVLQAAQGQNTARQAMISAGFLKETPAYTINKICGSWHSLKEDGVIAWNLPVREMCMTLWFSMAFMRFFMDIIWV